jgi:5-methylcytosine-specific restriction endonuclease McrA
VSAYCLSHLSDSVLLRDLAVLIAQDRATTAALLAHLAEVDARKLYLPAAHPSMFSYCIHELRLSEDAAYKRIQAARMARQFPAIFTALADGRLHLSGVVLLAPHLTAANAEELLAAATGTRKAEIEEWLAQRFPRSELLPLVQALPAAAPPPDDQLAPGQVGSHGPGEGQLAPGRVETSAPRPRVAPVAPERYALQLTIGKGTHDKLRYAQALLSHQIPAGEVAEVLDRALDALIRQLERRKFADTSRPRPRPRRSSANPRHIPAEVKRAVWARDGGQCTFMSETGRRCPARSRLEFDHSEPVARGGQATVANVRLACRLCRARHNRHYAASGFMPRWRTGARSYTLGQ